MHSNKSILLFLLIIALFFALINGYNSTKLSDKRNVEKKSENVPGRIVNGTAAFVGQFPQQVSLRRKNSQSHFCGGNIITSTWILTAAHCMFSIKTAELIEPFTVIVVAGETALKHTSVAHQWRFVSKIVVHPKFNNLTLDNDVALMQLKEPLEYNDRVRPTPIVKNNWKPGTLCQVSGWGYQKYEEKIISGQLLYVDVPLMSSYLCRTLQYLPKGSLCAGYLEGQRDACDGDSGGGLVCDGFLTGVVSGGHECARPRLPGLYADVKFHTPWIIEHVNFENDSLYVTEYPKGRNDATLSHRPLQIVSLLLVCLAFYVTNKLL